MAIKEPSRVNSMYESFSDKGYPHKGLRQGGIKFDEREDREVAYRATNGIHTVIDAEGAILLDLSTGSIWSLNRVGAKVWLQFFANGATAQRDAMINWFGLDADVPRRRIRADLLIFLRRLHENGLIYEVSCIGNSADRRTVSSDKRICEWSLKNAEILGQYVEESARGPMVSALVGILLVDVVFTLRGFRSLCAVVRRFPIRGRRRIDRAFPVDSVCAAVGKVCVYYPRDLACLQRSASIVCLLRWYGIPAELVIGVRRFPFGGHAWVQVDGRAIDATRTDYGAYTRILCC